MASNATLDYKTVINNLDVKNLKLQESIDESSDWPQGYLHYYIDRISCRSIEISYDGHTYAVRILSGSSIEDYELALNFTNTLASILDVSIESEDHEKLLDLDSFNDIYNLEWAKEHCERMVELIVGMCIQKKEVLQLSGATKNFSVGPNFVESLLNKPESVEYLFFERFRRFQHIESEDIYVGSKIILTNKEETLQVSEAVLGESVTTLIPIDVDAIAISSEEQDSFEVPTNAFVENLSTPSTLLSEDYLLVEGISGDDWLALATKLQPFKLKSVLEVGKPVSKEEREESVDDRKSSSYRESFESEEWEKLIYAPFIVFILVAAADGSIDSKELKAFSKALEKQENELLLEILRHNSQNPQEIMEFLSTDDMNIGLLFKEIIDAINQKLSETYAFRFKATIYSIAEQVARSSSGFFGFGKKIRKQEKEVLNVIAAVLHEA